MDMSRVATHLLQLESFDTPTVCNALEIIEPRRRMFGYTNHNILATNASCGPAAGLALTATMRSAIPPALAGDELKAQRMEYYTYMEQDTGVNKICAMQDLDGHDAGRGPFWGEFNVRVHKALGFRGILTDGSVRDARKLPSDILLLSQGLRPSHAHVHIVSFGQTINIFGMSVTPGEVIHMDEHGAVTFPLDMLEQVIPKAELFVASEAPIIEACKAERLTLEESRAQAAPIR
jgi:regulator of RNase E activity RraA